MSRIVRCADAEPDGARVVRATAALASRPPRAGRAHLQRAGHDPLHRLPGRRRPRAQPDRDPPSSPGVAHDLPDRRPRRRPGDPAAVRASRYRSWIFDRCRRRSGRRKPCGSPPRRRFDPSIWSRGPLVRAILVRLADARHRLFLTLHHIIFDGVALYRVFLPELADTVRGVRRRASLAVGGAAHPVCRFRALATGHPAGQRDVDEAARLLATAPPRGARAPASDGSPAPRRAVVPRRHGALRAVEDGDRGAEAPGHARAGQPVHGPAGGLHDAPASLFGAGRSGRRHGDGRAEASRAGAAARDTS